MCIVQVEMLVSQRSHKYFEADFKQQTDQFAAT